MQLPLVVCQVALFECATVARECVCALCMVYATRAPYTEILTQASHTHRTIRYKHIFNCKQKHQGLHTKRQIKRRINENNTKTLTLCRTTTVADCVWSRLIAGLSCVSCSNRSKFKMFNFHIPLLLSSFFVFVHFLWCVWLVSANHL